MATMQLGNPAIDRSGWVSASSVTLVNLNNPARRRGVLTEVSLWAYTNMGNTKIGIVYETGVNTYTVRGVTTVSNVAAGSKKNYTGLSLEIQKGDFIALVGASGGLESEASGGEVGYVLKNSDELTEGNSFVISGTSANGMLSFEGVGEIKVSNALLLNLN